MKTIADQSFRHGFAATALAALFVLFAFQLSASEPRVIEVHTVNQLYAAVNNGANAGATIHLAPGSYVLSPENDEGVARPNYGSLRLRPGMSLVGSEQRVDSNFDGIPDPVDPATPENFAVSGTETTIDGSALELPMKVRKDCGSSITTFPEPMIAVNQNNTVLFLHLVGGINVTVGEPANPVDSVKSISMKIEDTVVESVFVAISFSNLGCGRSHARSELIFSRNVVRNADFFGLVTGNFIAGNDANDTSNGPEMKITVSYNLFYNNAGTAFSARGGAIGSDGGLTTVEMHRNVFINNGLNLLAIGGGGGRLGANISVGNRLQLTSQFDTFGEPSFPQSLLLIGGRSVGPGDPLHCSLKAEFFHPAFIRDTPANKESPELLILGGEGAGSGNRALVLIRHSTVKTTAGAPTSGSLVIQDETEMGTVPNTARLMGSREDFVRLNQGLRAPAAKFFVKK